MGQAMAGDAFFLFPPSKSQGLKKGATKAPHFCRMLPTKLNRPERVTSGRTTKGPPCPPDGARQAEGAGRSQDAESIKFSALSPEGLQGMANPFDIRRPRAGDALGSKNHLGSISLRHSPVGPAVGATDHGLKNAAAKCCGNSMCQQWMTCQGTDVFPADSFGPRPGRNQSHDGRQFLFHATGGKPNQETVFNSE